MVVDEFLERIPRSVIYLDLSYTSVLGYGLKYLEKRRMKIKITNTMISEEDYSFCQFTV